MDTGLPSVRRIQKTIQEKKSVEVKLLISEVLKGKIFWQDPNCLCLIEESGQEVLIWRQAVAYIKPLP
jgi:host factor-I protein